MAPGAEGSSPSVHPKYSLQPAMPSRLRFFYAPIAQLDRAPDFESVGRRFEPCWARQEQERTSRVDLLWLEFLAAKLRGMRSLHIFKFVLKALREAKVLRRL